MSPSIKSGSPGCPLSGGGGGAGGGDAGVDPHGQAAGLERQEQKGQNRTKRRRCYICRNKAAEADPKHKTSYYCAHPDCGEDRPICSPTRGTNCWAEHWQKGWPKKRAKTKRLSRGGRADHRAAEDEYSS